MALDVYELFRTVDRMDAGGFAASFTDDGSFRFGNWPTVKGRAEITDSVNEFFNSIKALHHRVIDEWTDGPVRVAEVEVTYMRLDDAEVDLMAACVFRTHGDLIADYRIYMDISPLYTEG
jgi:limonene-1,2-epoxide hydrolase